MGSYTADVLAVGFFILEWLVYAITLEHTAYGRDSLSARMDAYREVWIRQLLDREARMVDIQIMASLQNGTAFFASPAPLPLAARWRCCAQAVMQPSCSASCRWT